MTQTHNVLGVRPVAVAPRRRFGAIKAIGLSAFSKDLWKDVAVNWRGIGLRYMLLLLVLTWLVVSIKTTRGFLQFADGEAQQMIRQVPTVTITDGVVSIDKPEPYIVKEPRTGEPIVIVDTTGEITTPPGRGMLLTRSALIYQDSQKTQTYDLSQVKSFRLDQARVNGWLDTARTWFFPLFFLVCLGASFVWRLLLMLIGGAIGLLFANAFHAPISYAATMRLSAIAMTPGILLSTILSLTQLPGLGCSGFFIGLGLFLTILILAVKANAVAPVSPVGGFPVIQPPPPPPDAPLPPPPVV